MKPKRAFTLLELLVVIGILTVLAALLLPALGRGKEAARATACLSNLHQIGVALQVYVSENQNRLPVMFDWSADSSANTNGPSMNQTLGRETGNTNVFRCPSDRVGIFEATGCSYSWNVLLNDQDADHLHLLGMSFAPHQIPLVFDKESFHRARGPARAVNYLFADQHLKNLLELQGPSQ
jgi:prepilin-type N-terminal cleavage/methylation domain-containing protein